MCEYAAEVHQELTCDKFVFGLTDDCLNERKKRLLHKENLDLATAVGQAQRAESSGTTNQRNEHSVKGKCYRTKS